MLFLLRSTYVYQCVLHACLDRTQCRGVKQPSPCPPYAYAALARLASSGAIYLYQGQPFLCKRLLLDARQAIVYRAAVRYYTRIIDMTDVHVLGGTAAYPSAPPACNAGGSAVCEQCLVTVRFLGYYRVWQGTGQVWQGTGQV